MTNSFDIQNYNFGKVPYALTAMNQRKRNAPKTPLKNVILEQDDKTRRRLMDKLSTRAYTD